MTLRVSSVELLSTTITSYAVSPSWLIRLSSVPGRISQRLYVATTTETSGSVIFSCCHKRHRKHKRRGRGVAADIGHVKCVAQMAIVIYSHCETTPAPIDVDAVRRQTISDSGVDEIHTRTKTDRRTIKLDRSLTGFDINRSSECF